MDDQELREISRDPRFSGRLKKKTKKEKEAFKSLFEGLEEEETFRDKRGRPWPRKPLKYAKQLIKEEEEQKRVERDSDIDTTSSDSKEDSSSWSDTSSSERGAVEENLVDLQEADWCELVKDAEVVEEATYRLAVLHFDWDNSNAEAIFIALESFLPSGSTLEKVTIYPSEYGMRKMAEEEKYGPKDIWEDGGDANGEKTIDDAELGENLELPVDMDADEKKAWKVTSVQMRRRLRRYQLQRLKYFYAIAEFDSKETAAAVYEACDGVEFANTGIRFDLRFVRDEETFSVPPEWSHAVSECREVNRTKYKPRTIENTALHSTRITLSWDRTPAARTQWLREQFEAEAEPKKLFTEGKVQLSEYLALSSSGQSTAAPSDVDEPGPAPTVPRIHRHRPRKVPPEELRAALLSAINDGGAATEKPDTEGHENEGEYSQGSGASEEEEIFDLNDSGSKTSSSQDEEYDLTPEDEIMTSKKRRSKKTSILSSKGGGKAVSKKCMPEAMDSEDSDSSLNFDDMDRLSDASDEGGAASQRRERRRVDEDGRDNEESKETKRKKRKLSMRRKAQIKKQKQAKNRERLKELWTGASENDSRFDIFLTDPTFGVSQMHRDYREAEEFLNFMRRRRVSLLSKKGDGSGPAVVDSSSA